MVVMVANIPEEYGAFGSFRETVSLPQGRRMFRRPPGIELVALVASQAGTAPAPVLAKRRLVIKPAGSDREALHYIRGAAANGRVAL